MGIRQIIRDALDAGKNSAASSVTRQKLKDKADNIRAQRNSRTAPILTMSDKHLDNDKQWLADEKTQIDLDYEASMKAAEALKAKRDTDTQQYSTVEAEWQKRIAGAQREVLEALSARRAQLTQQQQAVETRYNASLKSLSFWDFGARQRARKNYKQEVKLLALQAKQINKESSGWQVYKATKVLEKSYQEKLKADAALFVQQDAALAKQIEAETKLHTENRDKSHAQAEAYYQVSEDVYNQERQDLRDHNRQQSAAARQAKILDLKAFSVGAVRYAGGATKHLVDPAWRNTRQHASNLKQKINQAANKAWADFVGQTARSRYANRAAPSFNHP